MKTIFFDIDGVLLDFSGPFVEYWNNGLKQNLWKGKELERNNDTWAFGYRAGIDDMTDLNRALKSFHDIHEHLPVIHDDISPILSELKGKYKIHMVTAYPNIIKRIDNLAHHDLPYDSLTCGVKNKLAHIQEKEHEGHEVVAIIEDGPQHLEMLLPHYPNKLWAPREWNYLNDLKHDTRINFYDSPTEWLKI